MTALYPTTKIVEAAKDWYTTDQKKTVAHKEIENLVTNDRAVVDRLVKQKKTAISKHRLSEQKLRAAVDELAKKGGQP